MEQHIQNVAPHQHPDHIGMKESRRNSCVVDELLEEGWKRKVESRVELFLGKVYSVIPSLFNRNDITLRQLNGHAIQNTEAFLEFPLVQKLNRFSRLATLICSAA